MAASRQVEDNRHGGKILLIKMKVNYLQFKKMAESSGKTYFNFYDLKKFYPSSREGLRVALSNWVKRGLIHGLGKGFYAFSIADLDYLRLSNELDKDSYISFEYALYFYNLIDQTPSVITSATKRRSKTVTTANWTFEYTRLKDELFFGYELKDRVYIATPEKALADLIYLVSRGKRLVELDTLEIKKINQKELRKILKKFPKYALGRAEEMGMLI